MPGTDPGAATVLRRRILQLVEPHIEAVLLQPDACQGPQVQDRGLTLTAAQREPLLEMAFLKGLSPSVEEAEP